ncbi:hypothetical protein BV898_09151 [Hypsibius exemplaris]|uniref:Rad60/SUMO-like domain-containing protein n=1 Tax=Hypsibius exemplaris TaxID=2072580 RepID=A0A1W0WNL9_HYPEX|nr:hypothetical protein BV898_09151 [Hypsibius exemplaris]
MASTTAGTSKTGSYSNPYNIKRIVGKNRMKAVAAKVAAKVVAKKVEVEAKAKTDEAPVLDVGSDSDSDCVVLDSGEEDVLTSSPLPNRRRRRPELEILDSPVLVSTEKSARKRKKRLSKAEKVSLARKEEAAAASRKVREDLLANLGSSEDEVADSVSTKADSLNSGKELIFVLWKQERHKFRLTKSEPLRPVFQQMAVTMSTAPEKVLIFCNSDPAHTVSALDCLLDVGTERMFLSAHKEAPSDDGTGGVAVEDTIPEAYRISFNVQVGGSKVRTKVTTDKRETLQAFMDRYARAVGQSGRKIAFSFDGDRLDPTKRPEDYDLEGDEMIDAKML